MKRPKAAASAQASEEHEYRSRVLFLLGALSNLLASGGLRFYRGNFDLGLAEGRLMYVLGYETVLTARQASQITGIDKGATSRALAGLERRGLVQITVDDRDARHRTIKFTAAGQRLYDRLLSVTLDREKRILSVFTEKEVATLSGLLRRLHSHVSSADRRKA